MNQKEASRWELRLGLFQVVVLLGLTMGLLTCTFFLGYFSGHQVGQDAAAAASVANAVKLRINDAEQEEHVDEGASQRVASEVYAKLNENSGDIARDKETQIAVEMPKLGTIDTTDKAPLDSIAPSIQDEPLHKDSTSKAPENKIIEEATSLPEEENPSRDQLLKQVIELENNEKKAKEKDKTKDSLVKPGKFDGDEVKPVVKDTPLPTPTTKPTQAQKLTPTPKATSTKKVAEKAVDQGGNLPKGWFAQIAAPRKKEDAAELSKQLRKSGFAVIVEVAQVKGEQYYRVLAGPENSREQAESLVEQLKREPYIPTKPFIRQIK